MISRRIFTPILLAIIILIGLDTSGQNIPRTYAAYDFDDAALSKVALDTAGFISNIIWDKNAIILNLDSTEDQGKYTIYHTLRQVNNTQGVEAYNKMYVPVKSDQNISLLKVRVIKNNKEIYKASLDDSRIVEQKGTQYRLLALEGVTPGCLIESLTGYTVKFNFEGSLTVQDSYPITLCQLDLIVPKRVTMKSKAYNSDTLPIETSDDKYHMYRYEWSNMPANVEEEYSFVGAHAVRVEYRLDKIDQSGMRGRKWTEIGADLYQDSFAGFEDQKKTIVKILAAAGVKNNMTTGEKIHAIENHLKSTVAVEPNLTSELDIKKIVDLGYADRFSFCRMMYFCLAVAEINFEILYTSDRHFKKFDKSFDSKNFVHAAILYFPETGQYLSPSNYETRYPNFDNSGLGQDCLRVRREDIGGEIVPICAIGHIPENKASESILKEEYHISLNESLDECTIKASKSYSGFAEQGLRSYFHVVDESQRKELLEGLFKSFFTSASMENTEVINQNITDWNQLTKPLELKVTLTSNEPLEFTSDKTIVKIGEVIGKQAELYNEKPRVNPIDMEFNHIYQRRIEMTIPEGYVLKGQESLDTTIEFADASGKKSCGFVSQHRIENNVLIVEISEYYEVLSLPVSFYSDFSKVINASADFNKLSVFLERK